LRNAVGAWGAGAAGTDRLHASDRCGENEEAPTTDYTAQPGTPGNTISFAQTIETYWYTCTVPSHTGMTGQLSVIAIPEPSVVGLVAMGLTLAALGRRFILRTK
jgi:hypothetical protein